MDTGDRPGVWRASAWYRRCDGCGEAFETRVRYQKVCDLCFELAKQRIRRRLRLERQRAGRSRRP